jgi:WD40 repeat protein
MGYARSRRHSEAWSKRMGQLRYRPSLRAGLTLTLALVLLGQSLALPEQRPGEKARRAATDCYGDPLPEGASARFGSVRWRHLKQVANVAFSPKGDLLVSTGYDDKVRVWEASSGKLLRAYAYDSRWRAGLAFSPDGKTVAIGIPSAGAIRFLDITNGTERRTSSGHEGGIYGLAFAPGGLVLASGGPDKIVRLWDTATGKEIRRLIGHREAVYAVAFSSAGDLLASGSPDGEIRLWHAGTGKAIRSVKVCTPKTWANQMHGVSTLALSPNGKILAAGTEWSEDGRAVSLWDTATGKLLRLLPGYEEESYITSLAFTPDGRLLAVGASTSPLRLWDVATGKRVYELPERGVTAVDFSKNGKALAAGGCDGLVRIWDVATGKEQPRPSPLRGEVTSLVFSADGKRLVTRNSGAHSWSTGQYMMGGCVCLWDAVTGKPLRQIQEVAKPSAWASCHSLALLPDGRTLLAAASEDSLGFWDLEAGQAIRRLSFAKTPVYSFALSPDGKLLAAEVFDPHDYRISLREVASGKEVRALTASWKQGGRGSGQAEFSPDGQTLAVGRGRTAYLWDIHTGKKRRGLGGHNHPVGAIAFSPDGKLLASCEVEELRAGSRRMDYILQKDVRVLDVATGKQLVLIEGRQGDFSSIAFSPDGRVLAAANTWGLIRLWEVMTGQELLRFDGQGARVNGLAFRPDGRGLASARSDGTVLVWRLEPFRWQKPSRLTEADLDLLWTQLGGGDAALAYRAAWSLAAAPAQSVPFLAERLRPVPPITPERMKRLIAELDHKDFRRREAATRELFLLRVRAEPALRKALEGPASEEARRRLRPLLKELDGWLIKDRGTLSSLRALRILEQAGTPQARQLLRRLAEGAPEARLTREAQASLKRMTQPAGSVPRGREPPLSEQQAQATLQGREGR